MNLSKESFDIELEYKGAKLVFPAELRAMGYAYKVSVDVNGTEVLFEPDEERNFRAVIETELGRKTIKDYELLQQIAFFLEEVFK